MPEVSYVITGVTGSEASQFFGGSCCAHSGKLLLQHFFFGYSFCSLFLRIVAFFFLEFFFVCNALYFVAYFFFIVFCSCLAVFMFSCLVTGQSGNFRKNNKVKNVRKIRKNERKIAENSTEKLVKNIRKGKKNSKVTNVQKIRKNERKIAENSTEKLVKNTVIAKNIR